MSVDISIIFQKLDFSREKSCQSPVQPKVAVFLFGLLYFQRQRHELLYCKKILSVLLCIINVHAIKLVYPFFEGQIPIFQH